MLKLKASPQALFKKNYFKQNLQITDKCVKFVMEKNCEDL